MGKPAVRFLFTALLATLAIAWSTGHGVAAVAPDPPSGVPSVAQITPSDGRVVGIAAPISVHFAAPVTDRAAAERSLTISASREVPRGEFSWTGDQDMVWQPTGYWPAHTSVTVLAADRIARFEIGNATVSVGNTSTYVFTVSVNGEVVKEWPASFGKPGHETPWGQFSVLEKYPTIVMDSSTYGVPIDSPEGYKLDVEFATRIVGGIFVHAAPWSIQQQGFQNVSHGCINLTTDRAEWFMNNANYGDPVIITG
ncbi:L,D-transpeptidase [Skermania piniformis]|uniref:L,D-transpeptidase n=1 Tax=Skermania pinensis TaxID=39122 RepID=A0ABX8SDL2_9ACTN|nr:L,D-transpeptidase [Skermania piniformis]QXQ15237.1 L,D-transpeptidase [Skermania piniformis]